MKNIGQLVDEIFDGKPPSLAGMAEEALERAHRLRGDHEPFATKPLPDAGTTISAKEAGWLICQEMIGNGDPGRKLLSVAIYRSAMEEFMDIIMEFVLTGAEPDFRPRMIGSIATPHGVVKVAVVNETNLLERARGVVGSLNFGHHGPVWFTELERDGQ